MHRLVSFELISNWEIRPHFKNSKMEPGTYSCYFMHILVKDFMLDILKYKI